MKSKSSVFLCMTLVIAGATRHSVAQSPTPGDANQVFKAAILAETQIEGRRVIAMAKGIAADKFTWQPSNDGRPTANRTLANNFLHLAFSLWTRPSQFGAAAPPGFDVKQKPDGYENSTTDQAKIVEQLIQALAYAENAVRSIPASDLQKHIKLNNGEDSTVATAMAEWMEFNAEHVGQLMIYSRVNGFIPPTPGQVATPNDGK